MSKFTSAAVISVLLIASAGFSNIAISGKHKNLKKDGKKVDCVYCHTGQKIQKKKGQTTKEKINGKKFSAIKGCSGKDCHK